MSRINATQLLLDNEQLKEEVVKLTADVRYYKELNHINVGLIDELDLEVVRLEELCHANGVSI